MTQLTIKFFGKPQILLDQEPLDSLKSQKARAALLYLVATKQACSRSHLAGLLWSDMEEGAARASLRVVISKLKAELGRFLLIDRREIAINPESEISTDIDQLNNGSLIKDIAEQTSGRFLHDFELEDGSLFNDWVAKERERYHFLKLEKVEKLASVSMASRQWGESILHLRQVLSLDPWREDAHRQLILAYARNGDRAAALGQFKKCRALLKEELDLNPSAETIALFEQIKSGSLPNENKPASVAIRSADEDHSYTHNLPTPPLNFVGRQEELSQIVELLEGDECRVATLTGTGGIGKTRLGIECAHALLPKFVAGVFFVSLISVQTADRFPLAMANELNMVLTGRTSVREQLLNFLSQKSILLVLDNFEHLLDGIDFVLELLDAAPNVKLLITSREPLGLSAEWVLPLKGLPFEEDQSHPSAALFNDRAKRLDLSFSLEQEHACVNHICRLVEGMPLALELASAWVRVISCDEIAAEIEQNIDILETDLDLVPAHQRSMRAVFAYSWSLLTNDEREGFSRLSLFRGGFDRHSARQVADVTLRTLTTLIDKSLVQKMPNGRYRIHPLLQQFGLETLTADAQLDLEDKFAGYFGRLLDGLKPLMYGQEEELMQVVQIEFDNVQSIFDSMQGLPNFEDVVNQLLPVVSYYFTRKNFYFDAEAFFESLILSGASFSDEAGAILQVQAASIDYQLGKFKVGHERLMKAIPVLQQADRAFDAAEAFYYLGIIQMRQGLFQESFDRFKDSLALFESIDDAAGMARANNGMAISISAIGDYEASYRYYTISLDIHRQRKFDRGIANLLSNLASSYGRDSQHETALPMYVEALEIAKKVGEKMTIAIIESNLGSTYRALGDYEESIYYYQLSLPVTIEMGDQRWTAANYNGLGLTYIELERYSEAAETLLLALERSARINALPDALVAVTYLGRIAVENGLTQEPASWLTFVINHPSVQAFSVEDSKTLLNQLSPKLSEGDKDIAVRQANSIDLPALLAEIKDKLRFN